MSIQESMVAMVTVTLVFMVPIVAIYFYFTNKNKIMDERKLMIEKGITPPPLPNYSYYAGREGRYHSKSNGLIKGLKLIAIALGLLTGYLISNYLNIEFAFSIGGSILFFLGIVNIFSSFLSENKPTDSTSNPNSNE